MRHYIVAHADPDYPGRTITRAGHKEAQALTERLGTDRIDRIFSSPRGRAVHTAQYTADRLGLPIETQDWMQELDWLKLLDGPHSGTLGCGLHGHLLRDGRSGENGNGSLHPLLDEPGFAEIVKCHERIGGLLKSYYREAA